MSARDAELMQIVTEFREGILHGRPSDFMCAMVCWPLASYLDMVGFDTETVESDLGEMNHFWLLLPDGRALDPTADQFNRLFPDMALPPVYLGPPLAIHARSIEGDGK
jgi:hypothetical protein